MADAVPVSRKAPAAVVTQRSVDEVAQMREALVVVAAPDDAALAVVVDQAVKAGKNVIAYTNAVRVDN